MNKTTLSWLAGILEGEGSFLKGPPSSPHRPAISLQMCDEDIVIKVSRLFDVTYHRVRLEREIKNGWKPIYHTVLRGKRAVELMKQLRKLMGLRRKKQIDAAIACYKVLQINKLSRIKATRIRKSKDNNCVLARKYGVSRATIRQVKTGVIWKRMR